MEKKILINRSKTSFLKAFSVIEIAITILVIGVLIAGVLASSTLIKKFRIQSAQSLTNSSPIHGIPDSVLWLESSLDKSFKELESSDTSSLSVWYDIRETVNKNNATQSDSSNYPTYSNSINNIQAVKFDGTNGYFTVDGSVLNNTNYTIFVVEQRDSGKSGNYFIGDHSSDNELMSNKNLVLGYSNDGTIKHSQSSDNSYTSLITSYSVSIGRPRVFTFVQDRSSGKKTYINGLLAATSTDNSYLSGITTLAIGKSYQGQIGEVAVFARALTDEERQSIEDYLGDKWNSKILRDIGSSASSGGIGGSCVGGVVSDAGCLIPCSVTAAIGITTTTVLDGSGSLSCNTVGNFTGSLPYSCKNGHFSYTANTACSCASGYVLVGSACVISSCTGGIESTITESGTTYKVHKFNSSGSLSCPTSRSGDALIVGGGGGGGVDMGGGGAGGGVVVLSSITIGSGSTSIVVGSGGSSDQPGASSSITTSGSTYTALGGGDGGGYFTGRSGKAGASGGGACADNGSGGSGSYKTDGDPTTFGNNGGGTAGWRQGGGGGGGAGSDGQSSSTTSAGAGGAGYQSSITGTSTYYGGGGGGGTKDSNTYGIGGLGGGGRGSSSNSSFYIPQNGTANTGGGGGGCGLRSTGGGGCTAGGSGGEGVVIVRYAM